VSLVVRPSAAADLDEAFLWDEGQRAGLGHEFLDAVQQVFEGLVENPQLHRVVHRDTRHALVRRFPYGVFYRIIGDNTVVIGCLHGSRNPRRWKGRR